MYRRSFLLSALVAPFFGMRLSAGQIEVAEDVPYFLDLINAYRISQRKKPLTVSASLTRAAQLHAEELEARGYSPQNSFPGHYGADGSKPGTRAKRQGYKYRTITENIAYAFSPDQAIDLWKKSAGHKKNLLNKKTTQIGVGKAGNIYVAVFAKPK